MKDLKQKEKTGPKLKEAKPSTLKTADKDTLKISGKGITRVASGARKGAEGAGRKIVGAQSPQKERGQENQESSRAPDAQAVEKVWETEKKAVSSSVSQSGRLVQHYRLKTKEAYRGNATGASPVRGGYASRTIPEEMTRQKVAWLKYQEKTGRNTPQVRHRAEALPQGIQGERPEIYSYSQHIGHIGRVSEARANSSPAERGRQKAIQDAKKAAQAKQRQKAEAVAEEKLSIWIPDTKKLRQEGEVPVGRAATAAGRQMQGRTGSTALRQKGSQVQSQLKQKRTLPAMELRTKTLTPSAQLKEAPQKLAGSVPVAVSRRMRIRAQKQALQRAQQSAAHKAKTAMQKAAKRSAKGGKAAARVMASLLRALCSTVSGIILLLTLTFAVAVGSVIASPFGIFFAGENHDPGTITLTEAVAQVNEDYAARLEELQDGGYDQININGSPPDWREVIAVFACKTAGAEEDGMDVVTMDAERVERLKEVFWDMTIITTSVEVIHHPDSSPEENDGWTERILHITIEAKTADEMREFYHFTKYQNEALDALLEELGSIGEVMGDLNITQEEAIKLLQNLPEDLSPERKAVIQKALTLVGKVNYFWGGKSSAIGWDSRWGTTQKVTAPGSKTTGTYRPFGLDCSGYVDWVFNNALGYKPGHGGGAASQHDYCTPISWSEAQPGDLVFYPDDSHVGIVGGRDENGNLLIIHCSSGANNVVISGAKGFTDVGRLDIFQD